MLAASDTLIRVARASRDRLLDVSSDTPKGSRIHGGFEDGEQQQVCWGLMIMISTGYCQRERLSYG